MQEALPVFKYHPDPVGSGVIVADADAPCLRCNRIRGYVYDGPSYSEKFHHLGHSICPWCIADGSAAKQFDAEFTDIGELEEMSDAVFDELAHRTPGFEAWQQEHWLTCCDDAAAFLGTAGAADLKGKWAKALPSIKEEWDGDWHDLSRDESPSAYVFQCLHCQKMLAYVDED